ncbi:unnamed protein product [Anisakis simplex]|uniref:Secreted protein n=1 Tax=Anisakis simplex TaxID=6269 RepID=A0A0M3KDD4_ANISI|nr:unnamed protein product [Anisakis simplex]
MLILLSLCCLIPLTSSISSYLDDLDPICLFKVCVTVEMENHSDVPLKNPQLYLRHGLLVHSIRAVPPHSMHSFMMRKLLWTESGIDGIFTFDVGNRQIIVYITAPTNFAKHVNQIGVAITKEGYYNRAKQHFGSLSNADLGGSFDVWAIQPSYPNDSNRPLVIRLPEFTIIAQIGIQHITSAVIRIFPT